MKADNRGKVALVTGASKGIGQTIAERLAADGASIAVHYGEDAAGAAETVRRIEALLGPHQLAAFIREAVENELTVTVVGTSVSLAINGVTTDPVTVEGISDSARIGMIAIPTTSDADVFVDQITIRIP